MKVSDGRIVRIDCELRIKGGEIIESSSKTGPVEYKHGAGQMLRALEAQLAGLSAGEEKRGVIPAAEAFGAKDAQQGMTIPRKEFPSSAKLEVGARFEAKSANGSPIQLEVTAVDKEKVTAKAVHALADKDIEFRVKVLSVRPPPPPVPKSPVDELELTEVTD